MSLALQETCSVLQTLMVRPFDLKTIRTDRIVDVCITTPMKELEKVCTLAMVLGRRRFRYSSSLPMTNCSTDGMEKVVCVPNAKVPIVKIWDPEFKLACDMNVNNTLALENTRMIKTYVQIDQRVRPLAMIIKHWTKRRILNDAGTLMSNPSRLEG
jgi:DNA polymerase sigma